MYVTPLYAALLGLLFVFLSFRTLRLRRTLRIEIGDAGVPEMLRAVRVHANFAEYAPLTLLLILMLEIQGAPVILAHVLCLVLLIGRCVHAYGVSRTSEDYRYRVVGMAMTLSALSLAALYLLASYLPQLY